MLWVQGNWDMKRAFRLKWTEGHIWQQTCKVPVGYEVEFKVSPASVKSIGSPHQIKGRAELLHQSTPRIQHGFKFLQTI